MSNPFSDAEIVLLRRLWADGHSTAAIGRHMGRSKCSIVGKAHRLDLPARPSPIRRDGGDPYAAARRQTVARAGKTTLAPLASAAVVMPLPPLRAETSKRAAAAARATTGRVIPCCWPIGEPATREFRFCGAESVPGKPYCEEHARRAYVKLGDRREDVA